PVKPEGPAAGNLDQADATAFLVDVPIARLDDILFAYTLNRKFGFQATRISPKELVQQFYLFDPDRNETVITDLPNPSFGPCKRSISPDGKLVATDVRIGKVGLNLRMSIYRVGNPDPIVREWGVPATPTNPNGLYRAFL